METPQNHFGTTSQNTGGYYTTHAEWCKIMNIPNMTSKEYEEYKKCDVTIDKPISYIY